MASLLDPQIPSWLPEFIESPSFAQAVVTHVRRAITPEWVTPMPITGLKTEVAGLNLAVNGIKAEFNAFDPIKILGLQDRYDQIFQDLVLRFKKADHRTVDLQPENLLTKIRETQNALNKVKRDVAGLPNFSKMQAEIDEKADLKSVNRRIDKIHGSSNPRDDIPKVRGKVGPVPSLRQLQQQELQLRKAISDFVRVVKGAVPQTAALAEEMARIDRQLNK
ncbi:hypothetical protein [Streptomyces sp. NRRL B-3229]|uniref:hypothetical protein n=1 Tax=Streptomyces sp. NRRL B-3229 TaxID=1463836 RepID=UPI00131CC451|nr:hypothetical protein [Streptomyces sp. NRRL B-3229]